MLSFFFPLNNPGLPGHGGNSTIHYNSSKCPTDTSTGWSDGGNSVRTEGGLALCSVLVHHPPVVQEQPEDRGPNPVYHSNCSISSKAFLSTKGLIGRGETRKNSKDCAISLRCTWMLLLKKKAAEVKVKGIGARQESWNSGNLQYKAKSWGPKIWMSSVNR